MDPELADSSASQRHHKKAEVATDRPSYREARWEKAVKVYTVNQESKYLLVQNVHALGVTQELLQQFSLYGAIEKYQMLDEYPSEPFTEVYWIKFAAIDASRIAKKKLDNRSFFGKNLHVCYSPEFESVHDTREKLQQRRQVIARKTRDVRSNAEIAQGSHGNTTQAVTGPSSALATPFHGTTPPSAHPTPLLVTAPPTTSPLTLQSKDPQVLDLASASVQSHDSHVTQFPLLPTPPLPHLPMGSYPSAFQDRESGRTTTAGFGIGLYSNIGSSSTKSGVGLHRGAGSVVGPQTTGTGPRSTRMGHRSSGGSGMGHHAGGLGMDLEEGLFDSAGLSTEDRVAAYLVAESGETLVGGGGVTVRRGGKQSGRKRAATSSGEAGSKAKSKKRKRI